MRSPGKFFSACSTSFWLWLNTVQLSTTFICHCPTLSGDHRTLFWWSVVKPCLLVNACFVTKKEVINYIALLPFMLCHIDEPGSFMHTKVHFSAYRLSTVELHHISSIMICLIVTAGTHTNTDFLSLSSEAA